MMNTILVYLKDRNKTVVYLDVIYTIKIDQTYAKIASYRIHHEYSSGWYHTAGYEGFFCRILTTFPLPYP
jgi:hypothetical protein